MSAAQYYNQQQPQQNYQPPYGQDDRGYEGYQQSQNNYAAPQAPPPPQQQGNTNWGMKPSQPYAPPPTNGQQGGYNANGNPEYGNGTGFSDTAPFSQATEKTGARFKPKSRLNDPIFLVLYIANLAGFAVLSGIAISTFISENGLGGGFGDGSQGGTGSSVTLNYHTVYLLLCVCGLGLVVAAAWFGLVRAFTKVILEITLALTVLLNIGVCIYYFYIKYWSGAIIFLVIAILSVIFYWSMRKRRAQLALKRLRIPLARMLLQTTIDITKHHPVVYLIVLLGLLVQGALSVWYAFTVIAIYVKWTPDSASCSTTSCSSGKVAGLVFYATFSYYWISQVIANVILTTLSGGIFGGWYYYGPRMNDGTGLPKNASLKAFVRSTTLSLGSIAFGSLIVSLLELLRTVLQFVQQYEAGQGDIMGQVIGACAVCCVSCITSLIAWFNKYAYIEISLYGKAYIPAAKDTWRLMKDRGIDALINDSLVGSVIMWGAYLGGFLCGLFGYLYLRFTTPAYNSDGQYSAPIILFSFFIGMSLTSCVGSAIDAGVSTIFVGLGEDPMVLRDRSPGLFEMIRQAYPRVVQGIPHNG